MNFVISASSLTPSNWVRDSIRLAFAVSAICGLSLFRPVYTQAATFNSYANWAAAAGAHTTIDFEDYAAGTVITNQYANRTPAGVVFSSTSVLDIADATDVSGQTGGVPVSGTRVLDDASSDVAPLTARFVQTNTNTNTSVRAAGGWMIDIGTFAGGTVQFYDLNNVLIDSLTVVPTTESNIFIGAVNSAGIARMTFDGVDSGEYVLIDDVVFGNVPEPTTSLLAVLCVLGGSLVGRRGRR